MPSNVSTDYADTQPSLSSADVLISLEDYDDVVSWINDVLEPSEPAKANGEGPGLIELDRGVSHLVGTIELASEDTSSQVERIIDDISRGASRLTYDLHFMREGALSLQALLRNVESKSKASISPDTTTALEQLHLLDTMKRNMLAAREVLREAESWGTLESDVTSLLGEQNYEKAAERLSEANKSMVVFQNTPEFENRRTLMVSLQNQLEASLSSALVAAVNSQDVAVCRNYFSIFCNIQREAEFRNYYYGSRRTPLTELWQNTRLSDCDSTPGPSSPPLSQFLATFFTSFISVLQIERTSIPAIFPDPQPTLATLITSTLSALQPTFSQRLTSFTSHHGSAALNELIKLYKATNEFAVSAEKILEKIRYSAVLAPATDSQSAQQRPHNRRRSTRMSISGRMNFGVGAPTASSTGSVLVLDWDQDLFEPFVDFQVDYFSLERRLMTDALKEIMGGEVRPTSDRSRLLRERSVDVFTIAEQAIIRCLAFTCGYGLVGLVKCLDGLFVQFADMSKAEVATRQTSSGGPSGSAVGDLSDLDYTPEDWSDIQSLLHLLEAVRALRDRLSMFEGKLRSNLVQVSLNFRAARENPVGFDVSGTTRGALQLLAQSSLNNVELQALLDQVDPEARSQSQQSRGETFLSPTPPTPDPRRTPHSPTFPAAAVPLLVEAHEALSGLAKACQMALQDTILRPLRKRLISYPSSSLWSAQGDGKSKHTGGSALSEVSIPTFSLSPSEIMQRVAEGLLNLPRLFEVYADDDALSFSLETLPFINTEFLRSLSEPPPPTVPSPANAHSRRSPSLSLKAPPVALQPVLQDLTPEAVSAVWLSSLSLSLLSHLTSEVLPCIRMLSSSGAAQLASDLGYLSSIVMALNVEYDDLDKWKEYVEMDDATGRQKIREMPKGDTSLATVARLRGWNA